MTCAAPGGLKSGALPVLLVVLRGAVALCVGLWVSVADARAGGPEWSPAVGEALALYRAGDYAAVQRLCRDVSERGGDAAARRDAAALEALVLLRMPGREDRLDGRVRLAALAGKEPGLLERGECLLALGIAATALHETAQALEHLDQAAERLAVAGQPERAAEALVALAQAWRQHTEWEITPPRFGVPRPASPEQARQVRREQIARLRERAAALPPPEGPAATRPSDPAATAEGGTGDAVARIDLVLANDYLEAGDRVAEGERLLAELAAAPRFTPAAIAAAGQLAERYEGAQRWAAALSLYRRLAAEAGGEAAEAARRKIAEMVSPQLLPTVAPTVPTGQPARLELRARNVRTIEVEVRQLDLAAWLESQQGRLVEALLPTAGALQFFRRLTVASREYEWWDAGSLEAPLEFAAPPGAYVAQFTAAEGQRVLATAKRLVLVSDLAAVAVVGGQLVAVGAGSPAGQVGGVPAARFWLHGSFVPQHVVLSDRAAVFALPPEARVLREKRWVCLVQAGEHLALCRGELPHAAGRPPAPWVALLGGPPEPGAGESFALAGLVLSGFDAGAAAVDEPWRIVLRDTHEKTLWSAAVRPNAAGIFAARVPLPRELEGLRANVILRRGEQVAENVRGRWLVTVGRPGGGDLVATCQLPTRHDPATTDVIAHVRGWYAWGTPLVRGTLSWVARAARLPSSDLREPAMSAGPLGHHAHLDAAGQAWIRVPLDGLRLPAGPRGLAVSATVTGWEGREGGARGYSVLGEEPVYGWIAAEPPVPRAGQPVWFRVGWFDPQERTGFAAPQLEVGGGGAAPQSLSLLPDAEGWGSDAWRPSAPGTYEIVAQVPRLEAPALRVSRSLNVLPDETASEAAGETITASARAEDRAGRPGVRVRLRGQRSRPALVVVEDAEPRAAAVCPAVNDEADLFLPLVAPARGLRVRIVGLGEPAVSVLADAEVQPSPVSVQLDGPAAPPLPGDTVSVRVVCRDAADAPVEAGVIARLVSAVDAGRLRWLPGESRAETWSGPPRPAVVTSLVVPPPATQPVADPGNAAVPAAGIPLSADLSAALYAGVTLWADGRTAGTGGVELEVPLPLTPGLYRLVVLAQTPNGARAVNSLVLDTRSGLEARAEAAARWALGDRAVVAVMLANPAATPREARVCVDEGEGLALESLAVGGTVYAADATATAIGIPVSVPPGGRVWMVGRAEAVRVGAGDLHATIELPDGIQEVRTRYEVLSLPTLTAPTRPPAATAHAVTLKRTLWRLTRERVPVDPLPGEVPATPVVQTVWPAAPLLPNEALHLGEHLLVREEFAAPEPLSGLMWSQRLPPNCRAAEMDTAAWQPVAALRDRRHDELTWHGPGLVAGAAVHEYHLVAVRPGVCLLPPPEIRAAGRALSVVTEPGEVYLTVLDSVP